MLYVVCREAGGASIIELERAVGAQVKGEMLVCMDAGGQAVHMYPARNILAYSTSDALKGAVKDRLFEGSARLD